MNLSTLPDQSFLPRRNLSKDERRSFIERRDRIYSLCTPTELYYLNKLAELYESHRRELLATPTIFTDSILADTRHRILPFVYPKPNPVVRGLAQAGELMSKVEDWHSERFQATFIAHLGSLVEEGFDDVLLVVIQFCLALPVEIDFHGRRAFHDQLEAMARRCIASNGVSAVRRFEAVQRCIHWQASRDHSRALHRHTWRLLLEVAQEDMAAALALIDQYWNQSQSEIFCLHDLLETPELAYQLAVTFKPHHGAFAADMLGTSISAASYQLKRLDPASATALEKVMDASCRLLADWTLEFPRMDSNSFLRSMYHLFRCGNPEDDYWQELPRECLAVIQGLPPAEQDEQLRLLAQVVFYGKASSALVDEAHALFQACVARKLFGVHRCGWEITVRDVCDSVSILEDKVLSSRNRRIAACPDHVLLGTLERQIQVFLEHLLVKHPSAALQKIVSLTLALRNQQSIRKYHRLLRAEFETRARNFPDDAGFALKCLIQYCGHSQLDDQMYRKELCEESFQALLPVLEGISPGDAAFARTGIGWSSPPEDIW